MARGDQLARQWKIIQSLISARNGKSARQLADELGCHSRTVYRDLEALQQAGFPLFNEMEGGTSLWAILDQDRHQTPLPLSLTELMALYFSRRLLFPLKNTVFYESLENLFAKIQATLSPQALAYLKSMETSLQAGVGATSRNENINKTITTINEAIAARKRVMIRYFTMSRGETSDRIVAPYTIWFFDGAFYLVGYCHQRRSIRMFALDRMHRIIVQEDSYDMPADFNIDDFMQHSFGVFHGEPVAVTIWFAAEIAGYICEKKWHASQRIEKNPDGSILFTVEVAGTDEIKHWVLQWGSRAEIIQPAFLRQEIRQEIDRLRKQYNPNKE